jgi:hypothetical protein
LEEAVDLLSDRLVTDDIYIFSSFSFLYWFCICAAQLSEAYCIWTSPSAAGLGVSGSLSILFGVFSVFTRGAEGPEGCGSGVFVDEEVDGTGDKGSGDTIIVDLKTVYEAFVEDFQTWDCFPQLANCRDLWSISMWIKGILL